jgi:hypothetical protein
MHLALPLEMPMLGDVITEGADGHLLEPSTVAVNIYMDHIYYILIKIFYCVFIYGLNGMFNPLQGNPLQFFF